MDTSEQYIKMCEEAEGIQPHEEWQDGDYFFHELKIAESCGYKKGVFVEHISDYTMHDAHRSKGNRHLNKRWIWLPRQDQLQEMVCEDWGLQTICTRLEEFSKASDGGVSITISGSMEQLWLAFVMKEKFNKTWDGERWV